MSTDDEWTCAHEGDHHDASCVWDVERPFTRCPSCGLNTGRSPHWSAFTRVGVENLVVTAVWRLFSW
jgi:hypothetical protein